MKKTKIFFIISCLLFVLMFSSCEVPNNICDLLGHYYKDVVTLPTCETKGYTTHKCTDCNYSFIDSYVDELGHNVVHFDEVLPTCINDGNTKGEKCSRCDFGNTMETIPALGHDIIVDNKVEPTCTSTGLTEGEHCTRCDYKVAQDIIESLGHNYSIVVTLPTCLEKGYSTHICERCNDSYVDSYVDALGHDIVVDDKVEPTCSNIGLTEGEHCIRCDYKVAQDIINELGHNYSSVVTLPTCLEKGYSTHICERCNDSYVDSYVDALGHDIVVDDKVEPTCTETGLTVGEHCNRCDYKVAQVIVEALGHNIVIDERVEPTCTETGFTEGSHCSNCNKIIIEQEIIPIVNHNYINGVCTICNKKKKAYQRLTYFNVDVEINEKMYKDNAVLYLPANYDPYGEASKLIIFCKQGVSTITTNSNPIEQVGFYNYLLNLGYAILGVDGVPDEWKNEIGICERVVGNVYAAKATETAYNYIIDEYNIDNNGCFISGYSQGGHYAQNVIDLTNIPILAAAEQSPVCSMRYHQWDLTSNVTINGVKFTKGARINIARIYGFPEVTTNNDLLNLQYDETLLNMYDPWVRNTTNVFNGFIQKSNLWYLPDGFDINTITMKKEVKCPIKIWCSENDSAISADVMKVFVKAIQNAGGYAEISIAKSGGHGFFQKQSAIGYFYENGKKYNTLPIAVEIAEWFAKFGGYTCNHSYNETIVEPTCVEVGYTSYTCLTCGHTFKDNFVELISHKFVDTIIDATCTSQGYTLHECEICNYCFIDSYTDIKEHSYEFGQCIHCNKAHPNLETFNGKVISIMSASTSTFAGYIPVADGFNLEHRPRYPQDNLFNDVKHTWWMQLINNFNAKLGINESWAGSTISNISDTNSGDIGPDACMASITRIKNLGSNGTPDVILFYGGRNDITKGYTIGSFIENKISSEIDFVSFKWDTIIEAFICAVQRIKYFYPTSELVIMLPNYNTNRSSDVKVDKLNEELKKVCAYFNLKYVDLRSMEGYTDHLPDGSHPDEIGMDMITNIVSDTLLNEVIIEKGENIVYSVKHNLINGEAELHYYKGVSKNTTFKEYVDGYNITVLMNGVDITSECYKDGYVNIESIMGDIEITVIDNFDADGHLQLLPEEICSNLNIWNILEPENIYYTVDGWGIFSNSPNVHSVTFNVKSGDKIWATSFQVAGLNGNSANGTRITWFNEYGVLATIDRNTVYNEYVKNGYVTVPNGAIAVNVPMPSNDSNFEIYLLNNEHIYNDECCILCNKPNPSIVNLNGKVISIMSDSTSTFAGYIPVADGFNLEHRPRYPQDNLFNDVKHTWWMQLINDLDAKLGINESWAGSTISNISDTNTGDIGPDACMASITRIKNLGSNGTPNLILFYGGRNDITKGYTIGSFNETEAPISVDLESYKWDSIVDAFVCALLRIKHYYPQTELMIMLPHHNNDTNANNKVDILNTELIKVCEHYNIKYFDLRKLTDYKKHLPDSHHPDEIGMDMITELVEEELIKQVKFNNGENVVYQVKHNLINGKAELHYYKRVSNNSKFEEFVYGKTVKVLMNGIDITAECYNGEQIIIESVIGDLEITVIDDFDADGHLQLLPEEICYNSNIWNILEPENIYYTINGWGIFSNSPNVHSVTFNVSAGDKIWATSFQAGEFKEDGANGTRITWFNEYGLLATIDRNTVYNEFVKNGYITVPDGAIAVNIPMISNNENYEIYILNKAHVYEDLVCSCCGYEVPFELMNVQYDDHISISNKEVSFVNADNTVLTLNDDYLVATNIGQAKVYIDNELYLIVVDKAKINLVTIMGQSNAGNHFENATSDITCPIGTAYLWGNGLGINAKEPVDYTQASMGFHTPLLAELYAQSVRDGNPIKNVLIWQEGITSKNGKSITSWVSSVSNTSGTDATVTMIKNCVKYFMDNNDKYEVINNGIYWIQGESDVAMDPVKYTNLFMSMWSYLKEAGCEYVAFLRVRKGVTYNEIGSEHRDLDYHGSLTAQLKMINDNSDMFLATSITENWIGEADAVHSVDVNDYISMINTYGSNATFTDKYNNDATIVNGILTTTMKTLYGSNNRCHYGKFGAAIIGCDAAKNMYQALNKKKCEFIIADTSGYASEQTIFTPEEIMKINLNDFKNNISFRINCGSLAGKLKINIFNDDVDITDLIISKELNTFGTLTTSEIKKYSDCKIILTFECLDGNKIISEITVDY